MLLKNGKALIGLELRNCDIRIENGMIKEISENLVPLDNEDVIDLTGKIITPGFVNTHTHVAMSLLRGYAEDLPFKEWLFGKILPAEERLTPEAVYYGSLVSMMEMAAHGVVAFCDMYFHEDMVAKAVADFGLKALLTRGLVDTGGDDNGRLEENLKLFRKWNEYEDRIYIGLGPHAPYSCSKSYLSKIVDIAKTEDIPVTMHFFENAWEYEMYTPREIMDIGFHKVHFIPVHCTQLKREDIPLLEGSYPSINTVSNMKLGNGIPPVTEMLKNGIKITIGTDGPASNNSQNLLSDLRISVLAQKSYSPENFKVEEAFNAITRNGYLALRLTGGTIEVGNPADFAIFEASHIQLQPIDNFLKNLIHAYTDRVYATMVNGRFVYINGSYPTVDVEEVLEKFSTFSRMVTGTES
ncbi:amidohydrolase [Fervidobacterium pennivorans subsp. shakshaketiis]|jgi:5-methylthioadenosine/S-adenosylhomocysteine deaminase|uniref:Cytosine deaminase-like metal-dependent hydrolase n=1 Tax=Fervidobacterium pennivorans (strain DSM 9078 / Ven5) TaxID=771875 RepID=H9UBI4_FERPD|nr:amidohydrolase [Fervidobacterium pennivorans]AFG34877.1 cytosine deaminase-like metal-dependent hydrolase [Fervidobacterium pennivorans DSM 9078]